MSATLGWLLAIACIALATVQYGLQGFAAAMTLVVFWLLLQFNRALRVMRRAGAQPIGWVPSTVMLHAALKVGMPMLEVVAKAKSLGVKVGASDDVWRWHDEGGSTLTLHFDKGRLQRWTLERPEGSAAPGALQGAP